MNNIVLKTLIRRAGVKEMLICLMASFVLVAIGCEARQLPKTGGSYPPVTAENLLKSKFSHRTGQQKFDFDWTFHENGFAIDGVSIPPDLLELMLGPNSQLQKITGSWEIRDQTIHFVVEQPDGQSRECSMPIFSSGVIRIQSPQAQYVF